MRTVPMRTIPTRTRSSPPGRRNTAPSPFPAGGDSRPPNCPRTSCLPPLRMPSPVGRSRSWSWSCRWRLDELDISEDGVPDEDDPDDPEDDEDEFAAGARRGAADLAMASNSSVADPFAAGGLASGVSALAGSVFAVRRRWVGGLGRRQRRLGTRGRRGGGGRGGTRGRRVRRGQTLRRGGLLAAATSKSTQNQTGGGHDGGKPRSRPSHGEPLSRKTRPRAAGTRVGTDTRNPPRRFHPAIMPRPRSGRKGPQSLLGDRPPDSPRRHGGHGDNTENSSVRTLSLFRQPRRGDSE